MVKENHFCICDQILSENICQKKKKKQELITQYTWNRPASQPLNVAKGESQSSKKRNLLSQIVEYSMHCINDAKREEENHLLFKLL